jgi:hypothetical protein
MGRSAPEASSRQDDTDGDQEGGVFSDVPLLPPPFAQGVDEFKFAGQTSVVFLGPSAVVLEPIRFSSQDLTDTGEDDEASDQRVRTTCTFVLSYLPLRKGFATFGGLRILLVDDRLAHDDDATSDEGGEKDSEPTRQADVRILEEWGVIGEIWVNS